MSLDTPVHVTAMADQILAAHEHVEKECGMNAILHEDWYLGTLVQFALDGRGTIEEEISGVSGIVARVIPCNTDYVASNLAEPRQLNLIGPCDRCRKVGAHAVARIYIPAGASVVSVEVCQECKTFLTENFSPIVWRD
jgi:hypothetical protein